MLKTDQTIIGSNCAIKYSYVANLHFLLTNKVLSRQKESLSSNSLLLHLIIGCSLFFTEGILCHFSHPSIFSVIYSVKGCRPVAMR